MKRGLIFITLLFSCSILFAQPPANTFSVRLGEKPYKQIQQLIMSSDKGKLILFFSWVHYEIPNVPNEYVDLKGASLTIKLKDSTTFKYLANEYSVGVSTNMGNVLNIVGDLTKEQLGILKDRDVQRIEMYVPGAVKFESVPITEENRKAIRHNAELMLSKLN